MIRCCVTDRNLAGLTDPRADWIQIREKELCGRELIAIVRRALAESRAKIIVNSRMDVALAAGAAGLHLPSSSIPPKRWRTMAPPEFSIGVSCHTVDEAREAESEGADYVLFGPVFAPISKISTLPPRGLNSLTEAAGAVKIPVLALGGVTWENAKSCADAGAAGIAGISLFNTAKI